MKKPLIIFSLMLSLFIAFVIYGKSISQKNVDYLKEVNLRLSGTVYDITELKQGHDIGILSLDLISTSIKKYDERNNRKIYFGVIDGDKAEIIFTFISIIKIGDEIIIKGTDYKVVREGKTIRYGKWDLPIDLLGNSFQEISKKISL